MTKGIDTVFRLAELLSDGPREGWTKSEIAAAADLPTSTVYRLLKVMEEAGYIYSTAAGRILPNFSFDRRIGGGSIDPGALRRTSALLCGNLQTASEIILSRDHHLLWHIIDEHPAQPIKLRAHPGFVRSTYELDSISRIALASRDIAEIEASWDLARFTDVGVHGQHLGWKEVRARLEHTDPNAVQYDIMGNAKGIRRFSVAICDGEKMVCVLTVAEAATPLGDKEAHIDRISNLLIGSKTALEQGGSFSLVEKAAQNG